MMRMMCNNKKLANVWLMSYSGNHSGASAARPDGKYVVKINSQPERRMQPAKPSKEAVRLYMASRRASTAPPESPERIRELLGWGIIAAERAAGKKR